MPVHTRALVPVGLAVCCLLVGPGLTAQEECPAAANPETARGWESYREGRVADADSSFRRALDQCPEHPGARTGLGYVRLRQGRDDEAEELLQGLLPGGEDNVDVRVGLGILAWRAGDLDEVTRHFTRVRELDPDNSTAADYLDRVSRAREGVGPELDPAGRAWMAGDVAGARRLYAERLETDPNDGVALHRMALMEAWEEDYGRSLELFDRLMRAEPGNLDARTDRARVLAWSGGVDRALDELEAVLEAEPRNLRALRVAVGIQERLGRERAAVEDYDRLTSLSPEDPALRRSRARALADSSRFDDARERYRMILADDPGDTEARLGLARVLAFSGRYEAALEEYDRVLETNPNERRALRGRARTLAWDGRLVEGERAWATMLDRYPDDVESLVGLSQTLRWQGRHFRAREMAREALDRDPRNDDAREQLRWIHVAIGPRAAPSFATEDDSDDNRMYTTSIMGSWYPLERLNVRLDGYRRDTEWRDLERSAQGVALTGSFRIERGWTVFAGVGGSENDADRDRTFTHLQIGVTSPGAYPLGARLRARKRAVDYTALLVDRGVELREVTLDLNWAPDDDWRARTEVGLGQYEREVANDRWEVSGSVARRFGAWSAGLSGRAFGFESDLNDGYFDPDRYLIGELVAGWRWTPERWTLSIDVAPGVQQIGADGETGGTVRLESRLTHEFAPGRRISAAFTYSSAGLQSFSSGDSDYEYRALVFSASWVLDFTSTDQGS